MRCQKLQPNVNNIKFSRFFHLNDDLIVEQSEEVKQKGLVNLLDTICSVVTPEQWFLEEENIMNELSTLNPKVYIQGKLELCFFVNFIQKLRRLLDQQITHQKGGSVGMRTQLSEENAVEVLGPRLPLPPPSLDTFLRRNLSEAS